MKRNLEIQYYKDIPLRLINRQEHRTKYAKRFIINETNQSIWISNIYLEKTGTIKKDADLDWIFMKRSTQSKLRMAGININVATQFFCHKINRALRH